MKTVLLPAFAVLALYGCDGRDPISSPAEPAAKLTVSGQRAAGLREAPVDLRARFGLEPLGPIPYPPDNPPVAERIALGRLLFFDPILGGEKDVSCGTCHHPDFAFADGRQFGAGTSGEGLGPGRLVSHSALSGQIVALEPRNTPTVLNTAYNADESGLPSAFGFQFLDGRSLGLEEQATLPIASREEMRGDAYNEEDALDSLVLRLRGLPEYVRLFAEAFPADAAQRPGAAVIDSSTFARALAAYQRELVTRDSPYDRYLEGDTRALSQLQLEGLELFFTKAQCGACHNGPMLSDYRFIVQGVPQEGVGKKVFFRDDTGREEHTRNPADRYAFRTLTLRNIADTGPYMHDGVFDTLEEVVRFYNDGARPRHPEVSDLILDPVLHEPLDLSENEIRALVAFMEALSDERTPSTSVLFTVPDTVPSGLPPVFGLRAGL